MDTDHIDATEESINNLYDDYRYEIPRFQRQFSWDKDNFYDLVDDITTSFSTQRGNHGSPIREDGKLARDTLAHYEPYFLGSIILNLENQTDERYQIIDGQQRLTSVSILIAVFRDLMIDEWNMEQYADNLQEFIYDSGNIARGETETIRVKVHEEDEDYFEDNVLEKGATLDHDTDYDSEPERRMGEAIETFRNYLLNEWDGQPRELSTFLTQRVLMVKIKTQSLKSAYRLFNVTNARGMPLTPADLLKSVNLSEIGKDERGDYADTWEEIERHGSVEIDDLIGYIRRIVQKRKARIAVHEEFQENIFPKHPDLRGKRFIDELERMYEQYFDLIYNRNLGSDDEDRNIRYQNLVSLMDAAYPSDEWIVGVLYYDQQFDEGLYDFFMKLERRLVVAWYTRTTNSNRWEIVYDILRTIEEATNPDEVLNDETLAELPSDADEQLDIHLDASNFYRRGHTRWPKYLLFRIELARRRQTTELEFGDNITVEHILPRTPKRDYWQERFDEEFINQWKHKFGNLTPLKDDVNSKIGNKAFDEKQEGYFEEVSDLSLTRDLQKYSEWTPDNIKERHSELIKEAKTLWLDQSSS